MNENTKQALYDLIRAAFEAGQTNFGETDAGPENPEVGMMLMRCPSLQDAVQLFADEAGLEYP